MTLLHNHHLYVTILLAVALVGILTGCVPGRWDQWATKNSTIFVIHDDSPIAHLLGGAGGGIDRNNPTVGALNVDTLARYHLPPAQILFRYRHEQAHVWETKTGFWQRMPAHDPMVQQEQGAQCVAQVLTGVVPYQVGGETDALGYWRCPQPYLDRTRAALAAAHLN